MSAVLADAGALLDAVEAAFADTGPLARADAGYTQRESQLTMALAVARAVDARGALVVEAGTGIGKTFAYLVPALLSGARTLISTATKSLQDQIYLRDLPRLCTALGTPVSLALLKGRASYLCLHRLEQARQSAQLPDRWSVIALARVERWAASTVQGDLAEIDGLDDRSPVIPLVTSTRDNCLGTECPRYRDCHVVRARREAMAADVVVVNHHLYFADMNLRDSGVAELLPSVEVAIFDEAHQLPEAGVQFLGRVLGTGQVIDFARDLVAGGLQHARGFAPWQDLATRCEFAALELRLQCAGATREGRGTLKLGWDERAGQTGFELALAAVREAGQAVSEALQPVAEMAPDLAKLADRAHALAVLADLFAQPAAPGQVRWIDLTANHARLVDSPLDIRDALREHMAPGGKAWVFTSATLGDDDRLSWFTESAGLEDATIVRVGSPFDYATHARLYVPPAPFPRPNDPGHADAVARLAARCAMALGGRSFVLTTTLRALLSIAQGLRDQFADAGHAIDVLVQGSASKRQLLQDFLDRPNAVLVGSQSFWEGIDVPGSALQCVVIDKLPFPPPNDPLVKARVRQLEEEGRNAFAHYFIAEAAVSLKQGAGRLIRTETDRGLLVVCDPRLTSMAYGRRLCAALPPMPRLTRETQALDWLSALAAQG